VQGKIRPRPIGDQMKPITLDIETSGLDPITEMIIAIGYRVGNSKTKVIFSEKPETEKETIKQFINLIKEQNPEKTVLVTFRGKNFDIPFLILRAIKYDIDPTPLLALKHVDIHEILKSFTGKSVSLDAIREFIGSWRKTKYTGRSVPALYRDYLKTGDETFKKKIVKHLVDDVNTTYKMYLKISKILNFIFSEKDKNINLKI